MSSLPVDSVLHLTDKQVKLGNSNRPFPHSTSVCLNHSTRTRVGWTFSYICCIFVHPDLESVYCFLKYGKGLLQNYNFITIRHEIWRGERMAYGPVYTSHMLTLHLLKNQVQRKKPLFPGKGVGVLPSMGSLRYVHPQRVGLSAVLVWNGASSLAILFINRVWFLQSSVELIMFFWRSDFLFRS